MRKKDFLDPSFLSFCQQEYDKARHYLKNCGKPLTEEERWNIYFNKQTEVIFKGYLS
jgi:hypothetical protein